MVERLGQAGISPEKGVMVFRPHGRGTIEVESPEQLAAAGISVHRDVIERTFGPGAVDRYRQAITGKE